MRFHHLDYRILYDLTMVVKTSICGGTCYLLIITILPVVPLIMSVWKEYGETCVKQLCFYVS